ncbi:putative disease resistance RPP13-like protein 1 [Acorus gramineus]|uniref:Disease resistance RPP13-like protein 1 n=1 Tax=Acorus gramineus TaxID=55184 RepID=A0AAV9BUC8_ACOGR|nr:putative disease resistance RPP13-like protein 1 [Acorus gramineus]
MESTIVVSAFFQSVLKKAVTASTRESTTGIGDELVQISSVLNKIQPVIVDAEEKQTSEGPVNLWLTMLKDVAVAYNADDVLMSLEVYDHVPSASELGHIRLMLKKVQQRLDEILEESYLLGLVERCEGSPFKAKASSNTSLFVAKDVFGRDGDKDRIIEILVSEESSHMGVSALCIVGIGGIGKTTLAKLAYNDERVQNHFELKIWVNASECRDVFDLVREIRDSRIVDEPGLEAEEAELKEMQLLYALNLNWNFEGEHQQNDEDVLERLRPHTNLEVLKISCYKGSKLSSWLGDPSFSKLHSISFICLEHCNSLTPLGQLPSLYSLSLNSVHEVKNLVPESRGESDHITWFPALEKLSIYNMPNFETLLIGNGEQLSVQVCPKLVQVSLLPP